MIELKEKQKYCQEDLNNEFEDLIFKWKEITIFIKNEDNIEIIKSRTKEIIDKKTETFFIFAKGKAIETAWAVNVQLQKEKYILEKGYVFFAKMNKETAPYSYYCGFHSSMFLL